MAYIEDWTCEECLCLGCDRDYCTCLDEGWCCECRCGEEPDDEGEERLAHLDELDSLSKMEGWDMEPNDIDELEALRAKSLNRIQNRRPTDH